MFHYQTLSSVLNGNFLFFLLVWTRDTISRQSRVYCFCFCPLVGLESSAFSAGVGIVPSSGAGYAARRVSWKWSFYYLRSASKPVVPTLRLSQAWRKLIVPTLCSTAHQNPASASSASVGENPASRRQRHRRSKVRSGRDARRRRPGLPRSRPEAAPGAAGAGTGAAGGRKSWWLCVFPVIAMGIGKGSWLICLMNYASALRAALPASKLYYSCYLNPTTSPLLAWMLPSNKYPAANIFGAWSL